MATDPIIAVSGIAAKLAHADGLRDGSAAVAEDLAAAISARFAFLIGLQDDRDIADVLAAEGRVGLGYLACLAGLLDRVRGICGAGRQQPREQ